MLKKSENFLKNTDLMSEIHKSKMSYCYIVSPQYKYTQYDIILNNVSEINAKTIAQARAKKAKQLQMESYKKALNEYEEGQTKPKQKDKKFEINPRSIPKEDLVFRVMTFEHIPEDIGRKKNPKKEADRRMKVNFPPFKHYVINNDGEITEVVRSHWKRGLQRGSFSTEHGQITRKLAAMYMELVKRYSTRSNWRGYTYVDEMQGAALLQLTTVGLLFDESKSNNPFAYFTTVMNNSFTKTLNYEKRKQLTKDELLVKNGLLPSYSYQMSQSEQNPTNE